MYIIISFVYVAANALIGVLDGCGVFGSVYNWFVVKFNLKAPLASSVMSCNEFILGIAITVVLFIRYSL